MQILYDQLAQERNVTVLDRLFVHIILINSQTIAFAKTFKRKRERVVNNNFEFIG